MKVKSVWTLLNYLIYMSTHSVFKTALAFYVEYLPISAIIDENFKER